MRSFSLLAVVPFFTSVLAYAHKGYHGGLADALKLKARQIAGTPGSDGSQTPPLIGDLRFNLTSQTAITVSDVLLSNILAENFEVGTPPESVDECDTSADPCCQWYFISQYLTTQFLGADGMCTDMARAAIRLGFHDAGTWSGALAAQGQDFGGADGSFVLFGEIGRAENAGLEDMNQFAIDLWSNWNVNMGDLIQFMANHAAVTCPLGPRTRTYIGRPDAVQQSPEGLLPDVHSDADTLINLFLDKSIIPHELTALIGAHSTSKQFKQDPATSGMACDTTPGVWDVSFYNETVNPQDPANPIFKFASDVTLAADDRIRDEWNAFIINQTHWNDDYARAYLRLSLLGVNNIGDLQECSKTLPPSNHVNPLLNNNMTSSSSSSMSSTMSSTMSSSSSSSMSSSTSSSSSMSMPSNATATATSSSSSSSASMTTDSSSSSSMSMTTGSSSSSMSMTTDSSASSASSTSASSMDSSSSSSTDSMSSMTSSSSSDTAMAGPTMTSSDSSVSTSLSASSYSSTSASDSSYSSSSTSASESSYNSASTTASESSYSSVSTIVSEPSYSSSYASTSSSSSSYADPTYTSSYGSSSTSSSSYAESDSYTSSSSTSSSSSYAEYDPTYTSSYPISSSSSSSYADYDPTYTSSSVSSSSSSSYYSEEDYPTTVPSSYYSSSTSSYADVDPSYYSSAMSSVYDPAKISATVISTYYVDVCPTGLTTVPYIYTATMTPGAKPTMTAYDTAYFTTTVTVCTNCAAYPTTITLTKPIQAAKTSVYAAGMSAGAVPYSSAAEAKPVVAPVYSSPAAAVAKPVSQVPASYPSAPAAPVYPSSSMKPVYSGTAAPVMSTPVAPVYNAVNSTKVPLIGTETYAAPYAKFTGGAGREMATLGGVLGAVAFVLFL